MNGPDGIVAVAGLAGEGDAQTAPARPQIYSIAAHRGFADALVAGLVPRYAEKEMGLARLTLLLPSRRAMRTVTEAFIRHFGAKEGAAGTGASAGLLMPRMAVVGDLDLDETLGPLLDPLDDGATIPPAVNPTRRWLRLAQLIEDELGADGALRGPALLTQAQELAKTMDRLLIEGIGPEELLEERVLDVLGDLSAHWKDSLRLFARVQARWLAELAELRRIDAAARRNRLFDHFARSWKAQPPAHPVVAAGVTSAAPALARLLRVVAELPRGAVILPDLDLTLDRDVWDELGRAGAPAEHKDTPFAREDAVTHPQYHLKLLLNRMGVARDEVRPWHRAGMAAAPPQRSKVISSLFLPPKASMRWAELLPEQRRFSGVRLMESANPEEEAQAIALLVREALEQPEHRAAVVTPDRGLASRVVAHLLRWNIEADDTAGRPLSRTPAARVLLHLAETMTEDAAPVSLCALLQHPLVQAGEGRALWLEHARRLELALRGPRPAPGLEPIAQLLAKGRQKDEEVAQWWADLCAILAPVLALNADKGAKLPLTELMDALAVAAEKLCGEALWAREDGRALASFWEDLRLNAHEVASQCQAGELATILRDAMARVAVRPPYGGHPRVAVYGLLESRMARADLMICAGLNEGQWPQASGHDGLLPPPVLRALGVPGADFRIGLAAHDLAGAMGAPKVVLSRSVRDADGPAIPSRFWLRARALTGEQFVRHQDIVTPLLARQIDDAPAAPPCPRPAPCPSPDQRNVILHVTALDRLRSDPYQFYAREILGLRRLDMLDAEPSAAWQGTAAHAILERWHRQGGDIHPLAAQVLDELNAHPLMRALWRPRLLAGLEWACLTQQEMQAAGRECLAVEQGGAFTMMGVRIQGRVDRIDRMADGTLAIVDYKTGKAPSAGEVEEGYALQLGTLGLMARADGFAGIKGEPAQFEYWSFGRAKESPTGFGQIVTPVKEGRKKRGLLREELLEKVEEYVEDALCRWILGEEPFTARINPDLPVYKDYDQLMRLDEWQGRTGPEGAGV